MHVLTIPGLSLEAAVELRHCLRRVEELASDWHARDAQSTAAPRIAWLASEALQELSSEQRPPVLPMIEPPPPPPPPELVHRLEEIGELRRRHAQIVEAYENQVKELTAQRDSAARMIAALLDMVRLLGELLQMQRESKERAAAETPRTG